MADDSISSIGECPCLEDIEEASQENVLGDENVSSQGRQKKTWKTKKNDWLLKFFRAEKDENGKTCIYCRGCTKVFSNRGHNRLAAHVKRCKTPISEEAANVILDRQGTTNSLTCKQFVRALVATSWSFNGIENPEFKMFISRLTSTWKIPSRQDVSGVYVPELSQEAQWNFLESLRSCGPYSITIEFDHWKDTNNRSLLGVIATGNTGWRHLLDLRDVSLKGHYARVIVDELKSVLGQIPKKSINSLVSDSASTCKRARQDFVKDDHSHVIQHRCLAHLLNLMGSRVTGDNEPIRTTIEIVAKLAGYLSSNTFWSSFVKKLERKKLQSYCPTRWFSLITTLTAFDELHIVILNDIAPNLDREKREMFDSLNPRFIRQLVSVLQPLADCIALVEKRDCSLGEGIKHILDYAKNLFDDSNGDQALERIDIVIAARKAFLHYFNERLLTREEFGLFLAAYVLDRRFKLNFLTAEGLEMCLESIARIANRSGTPIAVVQACLNIEFEYYKSYQANYKMTSDPPVKYWADRPSGGLLSIVGVRLAHLKASSANIERTFSSLKYIQGEHRLNMLPSTLLHLGRLKIAFNDKQHKEPRCQDDLCSEDATRGTQPLDDAQMSIEADCSSQNLELSSITDQSDWLEQLDKETKLNFQRFFRYVDFAIVNADRNISQESVENVTEEDIRNCVRPRALSNITNLNGRQTPECITIDDLTQMQQVDAQIAD